MFLTSTLPSTHDAAEDVRDDGTFLGLNVTIDPRLTLNRRQELRVRLLDANAAGRQTLEIVPRLLGRFLGVPQAQRIIRSVIRDHRQVHFFRKAVDAFSLSVDWPTSASVRIPTSGPLLVVANHPLNGVDGLAIGHMLTHVRPDVKLMLTQTFDAIPGMSEHGIFVNASNGPSARSRSQPTREAIDWLKQGHVVVLFPAGQGSYVRTRGRKHPVDVPWQRGTELLIRKAQTDVLPVYVHGGPSWLFQTLRRWFHPAACLLLIHEIVRQQGQRVRLSVGHLQPFEHLPQSTPEWLDHLRQSTYALSQLSAAA